LGSLTQPLQPGHTTVPA